MPEVFAPLPVRDEVAIKEPGTERLLMSKPFIDWFAKMTLRVDQTPQRVQVVHLPDQTAAISTTSIPITGSGEMFRISYYIRITQAATTSSSVAITITWIDQGVSCGLTGPALTGNTTSAVQADAIIVRTDQPPIISFSTTYASVGATPMKYSVDILAEAIG